MFDRRGYQRWNAYYQSKLANLLFTSALQRRLGNAGADTIAVTAHPGASNTDLGAEGTSLSNRLTGLVGPVITQPAAMGALPMLRAATDPQVEGGEFYGPRWRVRGYPVRDDAERASTRRRVRRGTLGAVGRTHLLTLPMPIPAS